MRDENKTSDVVKSSVSPCAYVWQLKKWWTSFCSLSPEHSLSLWSWSHPGNIYACEEFCMSKNLMNVTVYELIQAVVFLSHSCTFKGIEFSLKCLYSQNCISSHHPTSPLTVYAYSAIYQDLKDAIFFCTDPDSSVHTPLLLSWWSAFNSAAKNEHLCIQLLDQWQRRHPSGTKRLDRSSSRAVAAWAVSQCQARVSLCDWYNRYYKGQMSKGVQFWATAETVYDRKAADILSVLFRDLGVLNTLKSSTRESTNFRRGPEDFHHSKD